MPRGTESHTEANAPVGSQDRENPGLNCLLEGQGCPQEMREHTSRDRKEAPAPLSERGLPADPHIGAVRQEGLTDHPRQGCGLRQCFPPPQPFHFVVCPELCF